MYYSLYQGCHYLYFPNYNVTFRSKQCFQVKAVFRVPLIRLLKTEAIPLGYSPSMWCCILCWIHVCEPGTGTWDLLKVVLVLLELKVAAADDQAILHERAYKCTVTLGLDASKTSPQIHLEESYDAVHFLSRACAVLCVHCNLAVRNIHFINTLLWTMLSDKGWIYLDSGIPEYLQYTWITRSVSIQ